MRGTTSMSFASGLSGRRRRIKPRDIGEQDQKIGGGHGRDARGEPIIVAIADLARRDRVVLIDDRHGLHVEQTADGGARVQIAAALFRIGKSDEDLAGGDVAIAEHFGPDAGQRDLADGGGRLAVFELQQAGREAEHAAPERNRAGRDDKHIGAARMQRRDIVGEGLKPVAAQSALHGVNEQRRADLDRDAAELIELGARRFAGPIGGDVGYGCHSATSVTGASSST